jgi:PAS domain S-box-containing protein
MLRGSVPDRPSSQHGEGSPLDDRRYRTLLQAFSDFMWRTDADGIPVDDIPGWREVTGQSRDELLSPRWLEGVHAEDRERVAAAWATAIGRRGLFEIAYRITGPGGTRHFEVRGAPVLEDDGEVVEWVGWAADVTDRDRAEEARDELQADLASERQALERVVEQAPAAIAVLWGPDHRYRFFNRRYEELLPPARPLSGLTVAEALPEASGVIRLLDRAYAGEEVVQRHFPIPFEGPLAFDGNRYYDFTFAPIHDGDQPAGVLVIAIETTEEVRLRSDLERRLSAERAVAEQLQRAVLPEQVPVIPGLELAVRYVPAVQESGVGGDWYDALPLPDGRVLLVIGDVAGRGMEAATAMVQLRSGVRAFAVEGSGPADILLRLSRYCLALGLADFVTVLVGVMDPEAGRLTYASAGHPPVLLVPAAGEPELLWDVTGPPIGAPVPPAGYEEAVVEIEPGATIVLYTDGLVEERNRPLDETLEDLRRAASGEDGDVDALCDRLMQDRRLGDDTALLVSRRRRLPVAFEERFPAEPVSVSAVRSAVGRVATEYGFDEEAIGRIKLAVSEAATNAVLHAYRDAECRGQLRVEAELAEGELRVVVADEGAGIRPREDSPGLGLGLGLISALTTRVDFVSADTGTEVHMAWAL